MDRGILHSRREAPNNSGPVSANEPEHRHLTEYLAGLMIANKKLGNQPGILLYPQVEMSRNDKKLDTPSAPVLGTSSHFSTAGLSQTS